jgi:hypothetical protein
MSSQRERGFLPAFRPERIHNLVKSAPNLDNKSRSSTSTSTDNIVLGNNDEICDSMTVKSSTASINSHHHTNTNYHSIYYERDLTKNRSEHNERRQISTTSTISLHNHSNESIEYDSDDSGHAPSVGCFSFVGNSSSSESKKSKSRYKKLPKHHSLDLENRQLIPSPSTTERKFSQSNSRKNSTDPKKKIQFGELATAKTRVDVDLMFYKRFEQSLDAVGSHELTEQDIVYIRAKPKNKLAMRLQKSLDAIDSYDIDDDGPCEDRPEKVYSKSIDDLSTGGEYHFQRGGSQFTFECFLKNGSARNGAYDGASNDRDSDSSQESTARKASWHAQY